MVGLTTAITIQEKGGYDVTIIAETWPSDPKTVKYTSFWAVCRIRDNRLVVILIIYDRARLMDATEVQTKSYGVNLTFLSLPLTPHTEPMYRGPRGDLQGHVGALSS